MQGVVGTVMLLDQQGQGPSGEHVAIRAGVLDLVGNGSPKGAAGGERRMDELAQIISIRKNVCRYRCCLSFC